MTTAFYAGTFDPPTNGHVWVIRRALEMFERVVVGVAVNPGKRPGIAAERRRALMSVVLGGTTAGVGIVEADRYVADVAREMGATHLIRGLRGPEDFAHEQMLRDFAATRAGLTTVVLMPPPEFRGVSSSYVKALIGPAGWEDVVRPLVPGPVFEYLKKERA